MGNDCCADRKTDCASSTGKGLIQNQSYQKEILYIQHLPKLSTILEASSTSEYSDFEETKQKKKEDKPMKTIVVQCNGPVPISKEAKYCAKLYYWALSSGYKDCQVCGDYNFTSFILASTGSLQEDTRYWSTLLITLLVSLPHFKEPLQKSLKVSEIVFLLSQSTHPETLKALSEVLYHLFLSNPQFLNQVASGMHTSTLASLQCQIKIFSPLIQTRVTQLAAYSSLATSSNFILL